MDVGSEPVNRNEIGLNRTNPDQIDLDQISIDTPELVSIEMPLAGIGSRFIALLIDYILWSVALFLLAMVGLVLSPALRASSSLYSSSSTGATSRCLKPSGTAVRRARSWPRFA